LRRIVSDQGCKLACQEVIGCLEAQAVEERNAMTERDVHAVVLVMRDGRESGFVLWPWQSKRCGSLTRAGDGRG
ncbi:hypothetical protein, partial [Bradyrhizobium altum]|uniref:hypothetical protein n=1 Tax=Bradyrhizobium altum TaxID=1571202 RepID=UPI001E356A09